MIYVHVPFCGSFCTYCDFYSEIACPDRNFDAYADEVCREILRRTTEIGSTLDVNTLYIGGGTPSVLPLPCLGRIISAARDAAGSNFTELTVEVNPEDITEKGGAYVRGLKDLGVNRFSMGIQSLDDGILHWMNRRHNADGARKAYGILRHQGAGNVSLDIIYGISHLSDNTLLKTVEEIVSLGPEHISAYQLSIEEGCALAEMIRTGRYSEASDEQCLRQYRLICEVLKKAGYEHYEISNWARPGFRAVHNSAYWTRQPYVGIGPGAHSLLYRSGAPEGGSWTGGTRPSQTEFGPLPLEPRAASPSGPICRPSSATEQTRSWNSRSVTGWKSESETLSGDEIREEEIMLGLRTVEGWNGRKLSEDEWFVSDDIISDILAQS